MPDQNARGRLVVVVGPSGVGKDSLLAYARTRLSGDARVMFVRRVVTRDGNAAEDHDSLTPAAFKAARLSGAFAVNWEAHGLSYGIPVLARAFVDGGGVAVVNGSRAALAEICAAFPDALTVSITADPETILGRLAARGREDGASIAGRLRRQIPPVAPAIEIDNSGPIEAAGEKLAAIIAAAGGCRPASLLHGDPRNDPPANPPL